MACGAPANAKAVGTCGEGVGSVGARLLATPPRGTRAVGCAGLPSTAGLDGDAAETELVGTDRALEAGVDDGARTATAGAKAVLEPTIRALAGLNRAIALARLACRPWAVRR